MNEAQNVACSLSGPELHERIQEWANVASRARSRQVEGNRIVSLYPAEPELRARLEALVAAEAECCSFLHFDLQDQGDELRVELRVPEGRDEELALMLGLVGAER